MQHSSGRSMRIIDSKDFVVRRYGPSLAQLVIVCLAVLAAAVIMTLTIYDKVALMAMWFILAGFAAWYVTTQVSHNREMLHATEFQNALFASALGSHHKFCIIVRKDKEVIYFDRSFQQEFPEFPREAAHRVQRWLELAGASKDDTDKVMKALDSNEDVSVTCRLKTSDGAMQSMTLAIEPIMRPSGFTLVRGNAAAA